MNASRFAIFIGRRLLFVPVAVLIIVSLSFALVNAVPSDPAALIAGELSTKADRQVIRHDLGLDQSFGKRYVSYMEKVVFHFDLGRSYYSDRPVLDDMVQYLPNTLELIVPSIVLAALLGTGVGTLGALFRGRFPDHAARLYMAGVQAIPDFFLGLVLIFLVYYKLNWAPSPTGRLAILDTPPPAVTHALLLDSVIARDWSVFRSVLSHSILPVLTLGLAYSAFFAKTTRAVVGRALDSYQVEFARACGLSERKVLAYAFGAARTPIITFGGLLFSGLAGGAAIVETVFNWGGLGQFAVTSILDLDLPEIQGIVLVFGIMTLVIFLIVDIAVVLLDPRVSYE